jgi:hypothetical protein
MKTLTIVTLALLTLTACTPAVHTLPPCQTEDQTTACYWDATTHGNGLGQSFIVTDSGTVVFTR